MATWVKWSDDEKTIRMLDGTIWKYRGTDYSGIHHYKYSGSSMAPMPGTNYQEAVFSNDFSRMQIYYTFGMMGMYTQMTSIWIYIGEGEQEAYNWMNGYY